MRFAKRLESQEKKGFGIYEVAAGMQGDGIDIIHLEVGRPIADTPVHIKNAAKAALDEGIVHYGDLQGTLSLREALAEKYREKNNIDVNAEEILITNGVTQAAFASLMALVEEGDEVLVLDPFYPQHNSKIELMGGRVVTVSLDKKNGFRLNPQAVEAAITPATSIVVLINPANPVGTVYTRDELLMLADICIKHDLLVIADEVYEHIIYDDKRHISIACLPGMKERTITINAFTKAYSMDGWRMGYAVAPKQIISAMKKITMNETTHPCVFAQEGALAAITDSQDCLREMLGQDRKRRDLIVKRLNEMPGVHCNIPEGTIYVFPDFSEWGISSDMLSRELLEKTHVAIESGTFYGANGEGHLRMCFGSESYERIEEAMDRIEDYLTSK